MESNKKGKKQTKTSKPRPPPSASPQHKRNFSNNLAGLLFKYKYDNKSEMLIDILIMISDHDLAPTA